MDNDSEQKQLDGTAASIEQNMGGHPLFSRPETEITPDTRRYDFIRLYRLLPDGSKETCPKLWKGSELRSVEQIVDLYGGGKYQCQAICGTTYRIQAYSEYFNCADAPRKPFHNEANRLNDPAPTAPPPQAAAPPSPPPPAIDFTALIKLMLEREAHAAEAQAKMQEALLRIALEKPAAPNPLEGVRDVVQLVQSMNPQQSAPNNGSDPVKMLERGIAMGKDMAGSDSGAGEEKIPWGGLVEAATVGLSLLKKKNEKDEAKSAKSEEKPKTEQPKSESPVPQAAPLPQIMFDSTGMPYTFIAGLGFVRLDPAVVCAQMYSRYSPPAPPQYPYAQPFGMPNAPVAPNPTPTQMAYPYAPMPVAQAPIPPAPIPQPAPMTPAPIPPTPMVAPFPQPVPAPAPPQTTRMTQPVAAPLPRPVPPPVPPPPPPSPAPQTVRSARLLAERAPVVPNPTTQAHRAVGASSSQPPNVPLRQTKSGIPLTSKSNVTAVHNDAIDELWDGLPELGDDFAQVVNDGMNSPMAQQIMQDPRYVALRDAVVNGEMSVGDVNEEFVHVLFGAKGG